MSFSLTEKQVIERTKTVTRRLGWLKLKAGDQVQPVRKAMGLKAGERVVKIGGPIRIVSVRRELLSRMTDDIEYGILECALEGFGDHPTLRWPSEFVGFFCGSHSPCRPSWDVTRIEFEYV